MLPCNSCCVCGTWSNKEVRSLKSSYGGKEKIRKEGEFSWGGGCFFYQSASDNWMSICFS